MQLLQKYEDVISKDKFDLGNATVIKHNINLKTKTPIHVGQFRVPENHLATIHNHVDELLRLGCIQPSLSPYNSPLFLVKKKDGEMRIVQDFRAINLQTQPDRYIIRTVQSSIDEIGRCQSKIFSSLDLSKGFWQQALEEKSRKYTAFTIEGVGRFEWVVTPMGLHGSPSSFARLMDHVMRGIKGIMTYIDDILVHTKDHVTHLEALENCFKRLRKYNLKIRLKKCTFGTKQTEYLGYCLTEDGVKPGTPKLKAVKSYPEPDTIKKVREFNGLVNYFRHLIPNFHSKTAPLYKLTRKSGNYTRGPIPPEAKKAFINLKNLLCSGPIVTYPNMALPFILSVDAAAGDKDNEGGLGAILSQIQNGQEKVIAYASRGLIKHEKNYSPYLLELQAATWGIDHFHHYLYGSQGFTLRSDHKPLEALSKIHKKTLMRLQEQMNQYNFKIEYRKGSLNGGPDALSRNTVNIFSLSAINSLQLTLKEAGKLQETDPYISAIKKAISKKKINTKFKESVLINKEVLKNCQIINDNVYITIRSEKFHKRISWIVPKILQQEIIHACHTTPLTGHGGIFKTINRIYERYWWPTCNKDVNEYIQKCDVCQKAKGKTTSVKNNPLEIPEKPNSRIHMDLFGPLKTSSSGKKYICVITDAFTKYTEIVPMEDKSAETVAKAFYEKWICRRGVCDQLVTDNGTEFTNQVLKNLCKLLNIEKIYTTSYNPRSNSSAESFNRVIIKYMKTQLENNTLDWELQIPALMLAYNTSVHEGTLRSPFFLTFFHHPKLPYFDIDNPKKFYKEDYATAQYKNLEQVYKDVKVNLEKQKDKQVKFDKKPEEKLIKVGQKVLLSQKEILTPGINNKFKLSWEGPYKVIRSTKTNVEIIKNNKNIVVHKNRVKRYFDHEMSEQEAPINRKNDTESPEIPDSPELPRKSKYEFNPDFQRVTRSKKYLHIDQLRCRHESAVANKNTNLQLRRLEDLRRQLHNMKKRCESLMETSDSDEDDDDFDIKVSKSRVVTFNDAVNYQYLQDSDVDMSSTSASDESVYESPKEDPRDELWNKYRSKQEATPSDKSELSPGAQFNTSSEEEETGAESTGASTSASTSAEEGSDKPEKEGPMTDKQKQKKKGGIENIKQALFQPRPLRSNSKPTEQPWMFQKPRK